MSNKNPKTDHLKPYHAIASNNTPLADKPLTIRLPVDIDEAIRALPNRSEWMRRVLVEAAKRELIGENGDN
ncbi:hypothetical protein PCC7424_5490 (plasmid) [Gloeothece citriformis PCC 7424]|uniref:Uncharacterized protein n=1 Tax=Gloeothece citriformis (strain PCC 7424) TaxID=65393 RepID=B7KMN8_GLOC7|nr:hypothetical protein [Gloeothece citriformis]ACK74060.1 hypothetical protein PCC7424_5490 [Gloeothece citriformis PCC 7424]